MKKQNVKLTLLASLFAGLLSQGALAATPINSGATVLLTADIAKTTCNVRGLSNGGTSGAAFLHVMGTFNKDDMYAADTGKVGTGTYHLLDSATPPLMLEVDNCTGADLAQGETLELSATGKAAYSTDPDVAKNLFGDSVSNLGYGIALKYALTDNSTGTAGSNNTVTPKDGYILPSAGKISLYEADKTPASGDLQAIDVSVAISPQIATWAASANAIVSKQLDANVLFNVAMN